MPQVPALFLQDTQQKYHPPRPVATSFLHHATGSQQAASGVGENGAPWSLVGRQSPNASLDLIPVRATAALGLLQ